MKKQAKRLLGLFLGVLLIGSMGAVAQEIPTYDPTITYGNPDIPYGPMVAGLIRVPVSLEDPGLSGELVVYTPENSYPCIDTLLVLGPDGSTAEDMAAKSEWQTVADAEEICVVYAEAPEGKWNIADPTKDIAFLKSALRDYVGNKLFVDWNERALYAVGYGEGGTMVNELAMSYPSMFAGIVSIGGSAVSNEFMDATGKAGSTPYIEAGNTDGPLAQFPNNSIPVPAWIINCGEESANTAVVDYWKAANKVVDESLTNAYGKVYQADKLTTDQMNNEQPVAEVWVSDNADALKYSADFNSAIWTKFLSRVRRLVGDPGGSLRKAFEPEDLGMKKISLDVDGLKREFYVYTPTTYTGQEKLPLVVCLHGYTSTARAFTSDTEWWRVAENRNFLCVFVQAYPHEGFPSNVYNLPRWISNNTSEGFGFGLGDDEKKKADFDYIRAVVEYLDEHYAVDTSRRYVTGHSNGGLMTCAIADAMPELFAAAAPVSGMDVCCGNDPTIFSDKILMPMYGLAGDHDFFGTGFEGNEALESQLSKWSAINSIQEGTSLRTRVQNGRYDTVSLYGNGIAPLVKFSFVKDSPHAYFPELAWKVWDEFFSKYTRNKDLTISYEGIVVG